MSRVPKLTYKYKENLEREKVCVLEIYMIGAIWGKGERGNKMESADDEGECD